jgi:hypothetical protein
VGTKLMLLDEPLSALDEANSRFFEDLRPAVTTLTAVPFTSDSDDNGASSVPMLIDTGWLHGLGLTRSEAINQIEGRSQNE